MLSPDSTPCARSIVLQSFRPYAAFSERLPVVTMNYCRAMSYLSRAIGVQGPMSQSSPADGAARL